MKIDSRTLAVGFFGALLLVIGAGMMESQSFVTDQKTYTVYPGSPVEIEYTVTNTWGSAFSDAYKIRLDPRCAFYGSDRFIVASGSVAPGESYMGTFKLGTPQYESGCSFDAVARVNRMSDGKEVSSSQFTFSIVTDFDVVIDTCNPADCIDYCDDVNHIEYVNGVCTDGECTFDAIEQSVKCGYTTGADQDDETNNTIVISGAIAALVLIGLYIFTRRK